MSSILRTPLLLFLCLGWVFAVGTHPKDYLSPVSDVEWQAAEASPVVVNFTEYAYQPNVLRFNAMQPYVLRAQITPSTAERHYIAAQEFFKTVATRFVQTEAGRYYTPYFTALELHHAAEGGTGWLELHFVPVEIGTYEFFCTKSGHRDNGEVGTIIVEGAGSELEIDYTDPVWDPILAADPRKNKNHEVWSAEVAIPLLFEDFSLTPAHASPSHVTLVQGVAHRIILNKGSGTSGEYTFSAPDLFRTSAWRKCKDRAAEIKFDMLEAVGFRQGSDSVQMFFVPTAVGDFVGEFSNSEEVLGSVMFTVVEAGTNGCGSAAEVPHETSAAAPLAASLATAAAVVVLW